MTFMKNIQFLHPTPPPFFCLSKWVWIGEDPTAPGRRNLGYLPHPPPSSLVIPAVYWLYLVDVSITYHARATHNSLQLKIDLN